VKLGRGPLRSQRGRRRRGFVHLSASFILSIAPSGASAQSTPPPQVIPPTREEVTRPAPAPALPQGRLQVEGGIERAPCALDNPEFRSIHFVLRGAEFDGLQGLTRADVASTYAEYMGRDVPISVVCEVRDRAATVLRNAGYIAAVQVPEQRIEGGIIHFQVLMAHLTQVRVRGEAKGAEIALAAYLNRLTRRPLFNRYEAERYLLLASDLPGYTVRLTLRPAGTAPGDVIGDVTVQRLPAYADFIVQNGGSRELGRWGGLFRGQLFASPALATALPCRCSARRTSKSSRQCSSRTKCASAVRASALPAPSLTPGLGRALPPRMSWPRLYWGRLKPIIRSCAVRQKRSADRSESTLSTRTFASTTWP